MRSNGVMPWDLELNIRAARRPCQQKNFVRLKNFTFAQIIASGRRPLFHEGGGRRMRLSPGGENMGGLIRYFLYDFAESRILVMSDCQLMFIFLGSSVLSFSRYLTLRDFSLIISKTADSPENSPK